MMNPTLIKHLQELAKEAANHDANESLEAIYTRAEMLFRKGFGIDNIYFKKFLQIKDNPVSGLFVTPGEIVANRKNRIRQLVALIDAACTEFEMDGIESRPHPPARGDLPTSAVSHGKALPGTQTNSRVFVVHGHDDALTQSVARTVERLSLETVILRERTNRGLTVLEKLEGESEVAFAIVLLTPDDQALSKQGNVLRARQNVVLELGFFIGKLGRSRVAAVYRDAPNFELPSDVAGLLYIHVDEGGAWRFELAKELKNAGLPADVSRL